MFRVRSVLAAAALSCVVACSASDSSRDPFGRDTTQPTTSGGGTSIPGEDPESPVRIKNLSMTAPRAESVSSGAYESLELTFVVEKNQSVYLERLQDISVTFGGKRRSFAMNSCYAPIMQRLGTVVTLTVRDNGELASLQPASSLKEYYCSAESAAIPAQATLKPWGESVTLELSGLLTDAAPWRATATSTTQR